jgi:acyl carrier protein
VGQTQTIEDRIREFVIRHFPLSRKKGIKPTENWLESGLLDSMGILDLVHFIEEEFSIHIVDEELAPENFQSLDIVAAFVAKKLQEERS